MPERSEGVRSTLLDVKRTERWISALEANGNKQIKWDFNGPGDTHCALGLLNSLHESPTTSETHFSYEDISKHHNISVKFMKAIAGLNDGICYGNDKIEGQYELRPHTFAEIANLLKIRLRAQQEFLNVIQEKQECLMK